MGPENREITAQASAGGPKKSTRRGPGGFGAPRVGARLRLVTGARSAD